MSFWSRTVSWKAFRRLSLVPSSKAAVKRRASAVRFTNSLFASPLAISSRNSTTSRYRKARRVFATVSKAGAPSIRNARYTVVRSTLADRAIAEMSPERRTATSMARQMRPSSLLANAAFRESSRVVEASFTFVYRLSLSVHRGNYLRHEAPLLSRRGKFPSAHCIASFRRRLENLDSS
jgi:hypothetical protein